MASAESPLTGGLASVQITAFAAYLREYGFAIGVDEVTDMLATASLLGLEQPKPVRFAWRSIACHSKQEWSQWNDLFDQFWFPQKVRGTVRVSGQTRPRRDLRAAVQDLREQLSTPPSSAPTSAQSSGMGAALQTGHADLPSTDAPRAMGGASRVDPLHDRSGSMWWPDEVTELQLLAKQIYRGLRPVRTRRLRHSRQVDRLDVRATLRQSASTGGALPLPVWRTPRVIPPRLFIFVDVSRSMESHAAFFLRVARAFVREADARVFVFHTKLVEVTPLLRRNSGRVQEKINAVTAGFGGGTRIASCLQSFADGEGRQGLTRGARLWIMSDGYDTDEPEHLQDAIRALRRSGGQVVWFHPTRTTARSEALTRAQTAIDAFLPLATLTDLRAGARRLM